MAAAGSAVARGKGLIGSVFRPTRGLFSVFILLCLLCLHKSVAEKKDTLDLLVEALTDVKHRAEFVKRDCDLEKSAILNTMETNEQKMNAVLAMLKKAQLEVKPLLERFEVLKAYVEWAHESITVKSQDMDRKLGEIRGLINIFMEDHDEL